MRHFCSCEGLKAAQSCVISVLSWDCAVQAASKSEPTFTESVQKAGANAEKTVSSNGSLSEGAGGIIPWLLKQQSSVKQA